MGQAFVEGIDWSLISTREDEDLVSPFTMEEIKKVHFSFWMAFLLLSFRKIGIWSKAQGAFLAGRQILDQAIIANEAIEEYKSRKRGVLLMLDFEKVYDHVDWDFLDRVLMKKGFGYKWRSGWECVRNVKYSILINGNPIGLIQAPRGLRQGDPVSPFLVDVLSRIIYRGGRKHY
ncbi:hypothetical protein E5676_scaffold195G00490 [Cucumis melo var. makuwa]|uniref:Reverse transcriptase domain-containing protein n=1 Tax=Cucumis melo var. makuwa TaxID=1194695 RepID=A0A5A7SZS6_CUCMM|nr:hypothetical protein E6C27_scaffold191G001240 [Cucumis melo var. makuwa]TYK22622.1 hypothetical protein E5676_scaffold195G00490 [Cucumis melo var. makuwa]